MNDFEHRLRHTVANIADDAPTGEELFAVIQRRLAAQRHRRIATLAGMSLAAVIIAFVAAIAALQDARAHQRVAVSVPASTAPPATIPPTTTHPVAAPTTASTGPTQTTPTSAFPLPAPGVGAVVTPGTVRPGETITIVGAVPIPGCPPTGTTILQSDFSWSHHQVPDFIAGPYDHTGHFTFRATLPSTITPGRHGFLIRCAGRNDPLGPAAGGEIGGPAATTFFTVTA